MQIRLAAQEVLGVARERERTTFGVPVERGCLPDAAALRLVDDAGRELPFDATVAERWPDGSVRWLRVEALVTIEAEATAELALTDDGPALAEVATPVHVEQEGDTIRLRRASVTVQFAPGAELATAGTGLALPLVEVVDADGVSYTLRSLDRVELLHYSPLGARVRGHGRHVAADGRTWLDAELEVELGSRAAGFVCSHRLVNREAAAVEIGRWRIQLPLEGVTHAACGHHDAVHATAHPFRLSADGSGYSRGIFAGTRVEGGADWQDRSPAGHGDEWEWSELEGRHGSNWVWTDRREGLLVVVDDLLANHPAALTWEPSGIAVDLWAPADGELLRLEQGMARRRSLAVFEDLPLTSAPRAATARGLPVVPRRVPPDDEAIGVDLPDPDELALPKVERAARRDLFDWYLYGQSTGLLDFGDCVTEDPFGVRTGFSANNEHDALLALLLLWLRSGEPAALASATAYADHLIDVDQIHHSTRNGFEVGGLRAHGRGHLKYTAARTSDGAVETSIDTGHVWIEGLLLQAAVTGDDRYRRAAIEVGDCLARLVDLGWCRPQPGPRNSGWPLIAFSALHRATGGARWLDLARRVAGDAVRAQGDDGRWLMRTGFRRSFCSWQQAILLAGLDRLLETDPAPDQAVVDAHVRGCRALVDLGRHPDGSFVFMDHHEYRTVAWYGLVREALAGAWRRTKDPAFLLAGLAGEDEWHARGGPVSNNDVAEWRGHLPFYAAVVEAGLGGSRTEVRAP